MCWIKDLVFWAAIILVANAVQKTNRNMENHDADTCSALADRLAKLERRLYKAEALYMKQSIEIDSLSQENKQLIQELYTTNELYKKQSSEISRLEYYYMKQNAENERLNKELKQLRKNTAIFPQLQQQKTGPLLKGYVSDCGQSKGLRNRRSLQTNTFVGFSAYLDHSVQHLGLDQSIIFNHVLFNDGGAYNNRSGIFTCPVYGVYMFFFEVGSGSRHQIVAKLVANGANTVDGIADSDYHDHHEAQGSNMAILRLAAGTHVWVENYRWPDKYVQGGLTDHFTSFSGVLLYQY